MLTVLTATSGLVQPSYVQMAPSLVVGSNSLLKWFILHVRDHENSEQGEWMGVCILYENNALFPPKYLQKALVLLSNFVAELR